MAFWALGIEAALPWGVTMTFLSMLPAVGVALVWAPVAIWPVLTGAWLKAAIPVLIGIFVIGHIGDLLRVPLVGKGNAAARLCRADLGRRRHLPVRHQWFRHRPVDCRLVYRGMVDFCRAAEYREIEV